MRRLFFALAFIAASTLSAQDMCSDYTRIHTDAVTGKSYVVGKESLVVSKDYKTKGLNISFIKSTSLILSIKAVGAGRCIDEDSRIQILFTDGTRTELLTDGKFNCENTANVYFYDAFGKKKQAEELMTKDIKIMRVWTSSSYVEEEFNPEQATIFKNVFKCLSQL
jgi:hypothetical protein